MYYSYNDSPEHLQHKPMSDAGRVYTQADTITLPDSCSQVAKLCIMHLIACR